MLLSSIEVENQILLLKRLEYHVLKSIVAKSKTEK